MVVTRMTVIDVLSFREGHVFHVLSRAFPGGQIGDSRVYWRFLTLGM